jgi:hypothetical protein
LQTPHSIRLKPLKKSTKKLPTGAVQSAVKVNSHGMGEGRAEDSCSNKGEGEKGRENQIRKEIFEAGFPGTHSYFFLADSK